jgi:hypothetical protein
VSSEPTCPRGGTAKEVRDGEVPATTPGGGKERRAGERGGGDRETPMNLMDFFVLIPNPLRGFLSIRDPTVGTRDRYLEPSPL